MDRAMELLAWRLLRRVVGRCTFHMSESVLVSFAALLVFDSQPMLRLRPSCELCYRGEFLAECPLPAMTAARGNRLECLRALYEGSAVGDAR